MLLIDTIKGKHYNNGMKLSIKVKRIIAIVSSITAVLVAVILTLCFTLPYVVRNDYDTSISYEKQTNEITVDGNSLKILQLTDLHVNGSIDMPLTFALIKKTVRKTTPDLIVITGDIFSSGCKEKDVDRFIDFMGDIGLPWAAVLGNHDDETPYSLGELSQILSDAQGSLFITGTVENMYGNYYYDVKFLDGKIFQLLFMDSRSNGFTQQSVDFYKSTVENSKSRNGGVAINNILFYHIPVAEMQQAVDNGVKGIGDIREPLCVQGTNVGFFDSVVDLGVTKAMIFGHDHVNNLKVNYKGVDFCYGLKSSTSSYNRARLVGGTLYTLNSNGNYVYQDIVVY